MLIFAVLIHLAIGAIVAHYVGNFLYNKSLLWEVEFSIDESFALKKAKEYYPQAAALCNFWFLLGPIGLADWSLFVKRKKHNIRKALPYFDIYVRHDAAYKIVDNKARTVSPRELMYYVYGLKGEYMHKAVAYRILHIIIKDSIVLHGDISEMVFQLNPPSNLRLAITNIVKRCYDKYGTKIAGCPILELSNLVWNNPGPAQHWLNNRILNYGRI